MEPHKFIITASVCIGLFGAGFAACGPDESREDAKDVVHVDKAPPKVLTFNNHYPNVEYKCDDQGNMVYVVTKGYNRFAVIPNAECK